MVTNKHQVAVNSLSSSNVDERKQAVRFIKNAIIGNRTKKELYLTFGIAPRLVEYLKAQNDYDLKIQAAVVLGSFAFGDEENIAPLVEAGSIAPLLSCLSPDNDIRLVEASAKALRSLFQSVNTPRKDITNNAQHVKNLITLLSPNSLLNISSTTSKNTLAAAVRVSEVVASIIARAVVHPQEQDVFFNAGSIPFLVELLDEKWCTWPKLREAALDALAALCKGNEKISAVVAHSKTSTNEESISLIIRLTKDKRSTMRILAATCVVNMIKTSAITNTVEIIPSILLTIINLFADTSVLTSLSMSVQEKAPIVFAYLITDSESLQKAAMEGDAILKLSGLVADCIKEQNSYLNIEPIIASPVVSNQINRGRIESISSINAPNTSSLNNDSSESERKIAANSTTFHTETVLENSFIALAAACSLNEDCRKQVIEAKLIPLMISSLAHPNKKIRASSCTLAKSLSRSIKNLRTHLIESGIAIPLVKLLSDSSVSVQAAASATICNIVLDFSPLKKTIIENGGIEKLVSLVLTSNSQVLQSSHMDIDGEATHIDESSSSLRLNCLWALKNLLYQSDSEIKTRVMKELHWDNLKLLFDDADINIQEQAFNILRNIVCVKEEDIEQAFVNIGAANLIKILERKLQSADTSEQIILQILYIIVNICSGSERQKSYIINSDVLLDQIKKNLAYKTSKVKIAAIWCIINLTWSDDLGCKERVAKLKTCGINELLTSMRSSAVLDLDVKERVKTALKQFGVASHRTTGLVDNIQHGNSSGTDDMVIDSASSQVSDSSRFGIIFGELLQGRSRRDRGDVDEEEPSEEEESEGEEYM